MLSAAARRVLGAAASKAPLLQAAGATRSMSLSGMKGFDEHESAVENLYFNKARGAAAIQPRGTGGSPPAAPAARAAALGAGRGGRAAR